MSEPVTYPAPVLDLPRTPQSKWEREYGAFLRLLETTPLGVPEPLPLPVQQPAIEKAA